MSTEIMFVAPDVSESDQKLFLGPFDSADGPLLPIQPDWNMAHVMHAAGIFKSVGDARRNGWDKPVPTGYGEFVVGKRHLRVFTLTRFD